MAPPSLQTYNTFTDLEVRDIYHRTQHQVTSTGNVIQKMYNHVAEDGSAILSGVGLTTLDTENGNVGQYSFMLADIDKPIDANVLTTANLSSWTANSVFTVNPTDFTIRANVATTERISAPEYRIGPSRVLYENTLGQAIVNSSLTTFGIITDFNVNGTTNINNVLSRTFQQNLPLDAIDNVTGTQFSEIIATDGGAFTVELNMIQSTDSNNSIAKTYKFPVYLNATNNQWRTLLPIASSGASNGNDVGILIKVDGLQTRFCLYRASEAGGDDQSDITINMDVHQSEDNPVTISQIGVGQNSVTISPPYDVYRGTLIHQNARAGCIGINTIEPDSMYFFDVNGQSKFTETRTTGNAYFDSTITSTTGDVRFQNLADGSNYSWSLGTSAVDNQWNDVAYGMGTFVAVSSRAASNVVMTSSDGVSWTSQSTNAANMKNQDWMGITYGNGLFVAVASTFITVGDLGQLQGTQVMTSPDGATWTISYTPAVEASDQRTWESVVYGNGLFVAVASSGRPDFNERAMVSSDGITWTLGTSAANNAWRSVTYGNGIFVAVATSGDGNRVMTSTDGLTWTIQASAADNNWWDVTYGNGLFVAVAGSGTGDRVMTSPDGITWTIQASAADHDWYSVTYGNGFFVAVARSGTGTGNRVMTSRDGITWTLRDSAADHQWEAVVYGDGKYVAVASSGTDDRVMSWSSTPTANVSGLMYYNESTGLVSYGSLTVDGLNAKFGRLEVTESISVTDMEVSGSLTLPGDLSVGGNLSTQFMTASSLSVSGRTDFDGFSCRNFLRDLGSSVGDAIEICVIDTFNGVCAVELILVCRNSPALSRIFQFCAVADSTDGNFHRLLPITGDDTEDVAVEIRSTSSFSSLCTLRLVRVSGNFTGNIECHLKVHHDTTYNASNLIEELSGTSNGVTVSPIIYQGTPLTQVGGKVGINTVLPTEALTLTGNCKVSAAGDATNFTKTTSTTFNFSDKYRLAYNTVTDSLDIERNTGTTGSPVWEKTATLASL